MKEFNLEKAMRGEKLITRCGNKAKFLFILSKKDTNKVGTDYPLYAIVNEDCGGIYVISFTKDGQAFKDEVSNNDLFMAN